MKKRVARQALTSFYVDKYDVIDVAKDLISFASITPQDCGAQNYIANLLKDIGFQCHHIPFGDIKNLYAHIGISGNNLCFAGHTDVVPTGPIDKWTSPPFQPEIRDRILYGRGASDMKGAVAAFISASYDFIQKHGTNCGIISLLITGDEEGSAINGTVKVLEWMKDNNYIPDIAIVGEPTNPNHLGQEIKIGRRGSLNGLLTVHGKQGHVAYQHLANNPLPKLSNAIDILSHYEFDQGNEFFNSTNLEFTSINVDNDAGNVIPSEGSAKFNVRFNDHWSCITLERKIRDILDDMDISYVLECTHSSESFLTKPNDFVSIVQNVVADVSGKIPELTTTGGTSDARFITNYCPVVECGAINKTIHQIDENAHIDDIQNLSKIYLRILERYFNVIE